MKIIVAFCILATLFLFQNCGEPSVETNSDDGIFETVTASDDSGRTVLERINNPSAVLLNLDGQPSEINLDSGFLLNSQSSSQANGLCLNAQSLRQVMNLLVGVSVCEIEKTDAPPGQICTFALVPPYAAIVVGLDQKVIELGAASDGCRTKTVDLCEGSENFESIIFNMDRVSDFNPCL